MTRIFKNKDGYFWFESMMYAFSLGNTVAGASEASDKSIFLPLVLGCVISALCNVHQIWGGHLSESASPCHNIMS